jgi:hypothetical protein
MFLDFDKKIAPKKKCWLDDGQHARTCVLFALESQDTRLGLHLTHCMGSFACHSKQGMS